MIFGDRPDKLIDGINSFMVHMENIRYVWSVNHFPLILLNLVYYPCYYAVMILNLIRESMIWWTVGTIMFCIVMAVFGVLGGGVLVIWRGYNIYASRFDWDGKDVDPEELKKAKQRAEREQKRKDENERKFKKEDKDFSFSGMFGKRPEPPRNAPNPFEFKKGADVREEAKTDKD